MDILPIISKYGIRKRNETTVNKTLDVQISNLNRSVRSVNENVKILDPSIYLKKVKGVELNREDSLNVSPKRLIYGFWEFPNPSGKTINGLSISFDPSETVQVGWGDGSVETIVSNTNYSHTYL